MKASDILHNADAYRRAYPDYGRATPRSKVYNTATRTWTAPVAGYWDKRGYTRCLACPPGAELHDVLIYADNSAAEGQRCDFCHMLLLTTDPDREG